MKKAAITILALVLMLSLSMVFVGCNKSADETPEQPSNAETLGTAVAVTAGYLGSDAAASAEGDDTSTFKAGLDLSVQVGDNATLSTTLNGAFSFVNTYIAEALNGVKCYINKNGVSVEEVTSDDTDYSNEYKLTATYTDEETGEESTKVYYLYVNVADGVDVDGTASYSFTAEVVFDEDNSFTFSGNATYDTTVDGVVFDFNLSVGKLAAVKVQAYANKAGNICVEVGADVDAAVATANAGVKIEIGKLSDGNYGAEVTVRAAATVLTYGVDVKVTVNATAGNNDDVYTLNLKGNIDATVNAGSIIGTYNGTCDISGTAQYVASEGDLEVGLKGTIVLTKVQTENN